MKSASELSAQIRRKKRDMEENPEITDTAGAGNMDGIPMDPIDIYDMESHDVHEPEMAEGGEVDDMEMKRKARLRKSMGR